MKYAELFYFECEWQVLAIQISLSNVRQRTIKGKKKVTGGKTPVQITEESIKDLKYTEVRMMHHEKTQTF